MIRVARCAEPAKFDERCRSRGRRWLESHPGYEGRPYDYWSEFEPQLRSAFRALCGYCAMWIPKGNADHFVPISVLKKQGKDSLAYEWDNLRYGEAVFNQKKGDSTVLDPFEVENDWFALTIPSMQLVLTDQIPDQFRAMAEFTLRRLGLRDGEVVVRLRTEWFTMYRKRQLSLDGLREVAPQIAAAVDRDLKNGKDWREAQG